MAPKEKDSKLQKSGVIYQFKCPHINCPEEHIGESDRAFWDRIKEHLKTPCLIHQHGSSTGHPLSQDCFTIIHREAQATSRNIKEGMFICVNDPSLNRNLGKILITTHLGQHPTGHANTVAQINPAFPSPMPSPTRTTPPLPTHQLRGAHVLFLLGKFSRWGCLQYTPTLPYFTQAPIHPYSPCFSDAILVRCHIYLCSLTFSVRPDEAASAWRQQKLFKNNWFIALFQHIGVYFNI